MNGSPPIDFTIGDILIPNTAYSKTLAQLTSTPTLKQARQLLGNLRCVPSTVTDTGSTPFPVKSFIHLVPVDTTHHLYNFGNGVVIYFDTDEQLNNSLEISGAYLKDKCFIKALNNSGVSISKGQVVRQTGFDVTMQLVTINLADATITANAIVLGVAMEELADGEMGSVLTDGSYQTDTSSFSISDQVFVSDTPGEISTTAGTVSVVCGRVLIAGVEGTISLFSTLTGGDTSPSGGTLTVDSLAATFVVIGGTAAILSGTGTPEAVVVAPGGSMFLRTDGGAGTTLYIKESGVGNTGWVAK